MSTAIRTSAFSFVGALHRVCLVDRMDLICGLYAGGRVWVFFLSHTAPGFQLWFYFQLCMRVVHWGLLLRLPWRTWVCPSEGQCGGGSAAWVVGLLAAPGPQGSWVGSYTAVQGVRLLMGQPLYCSAAILACGKREAMVMALPSTHDSAVLPCFHGCLVSSTGISHHNLLPAIPPIHLAAFDSSPHPGIAPQSLNSSTQPLHLPGDLCPSPEIVWLWQGLPDSHPI